MAIELPHQIPVPNPRKQAPSPQPLTPISIGVALPQSGRYGRRAGLTYTNTYRFWVDRVNAGGGLLGRPVTLIVNDDGSDPETCREIYERLIRDDEVDLLLGPCHSDLVEAMADVVERERRLLLQGSGSSYQLFDKGRRYLFLCWSGCDFDYPRSLFEWASTLPEGRRPRSAAIVYNDGRLGSAAAVGARHYAPRFGVELVHDEAITEAPFDYDALFQRVKRARPDMVLVGLDHTRPDQPRESAVRSFRRVGLDDAILWLSDNPNPDDPRDLLDGVFMRTTWVPESPVPASKRFLDAYRGYEGEPEYHHAGGYACCEVLQQAVEAVGSCASEALRAHVLAGEFDTVMGNLRFHDNGLPRATMQLSQWVGGELRIVYPEDAKTGEAVLP